MILTPGGGPVGGPTSKDGAGFLVEHSVRFDAPTGERSEAPYPYEVLDEDPRLHVIEEGDLLHVHVYPELDPELGWGATWVAVDLEFDDGLRLSDLGALDQYGFGADAAEQGEERVLVADQWNDVQVDLSPALGHRIVGVHVVADPPAEGDHGRPAAERATGWIDPPRVVSAPSLSPEDDPVAWVDTRRGTNSSARYSRGNTLPITALPHGFARFIPVTDARTGRWPYRYQQGGDRRNRPLLQGIAVTHQPSPWMGDRNRFQLMPLTGGTPDASPAGRAVPFSHAAETARPDLYAVRLADGTRLRLSPTDHGAILEVSFPAGARGRHLLLEGLDEQARIDLAGAVFDGHFTGWVDNGTEHPGRTAGRSRMFVAGSVDPQPDRVGPAGGDLDSARRLTFGDHVRTVTVRLATSFIGTEQARHALDQELTGRTAVQVRKAAHDAWAERLGVITVEGATPPQRRTLYGSLYRLNLYPASMTENAGTAHVPRYLHASPTLPTRGRATNTSTNAPVIRGELMVDHGFWDTYRTCWPAFALLYPGPAARLIDGFVQHSREGGWIPRWSAPGYADCMTGTSSDVAFADAAVKGVVLRDPLGTYRAALRNATVAPDSPLVGRTGGERAIFSGYVDTSVPESVSWSLEAHINDAALAAQARLLAADPATEAALRAQLEEEAAYLAARSANYALLFDERTGTFRGRDRSGRFAVPAAGYDPRDWGGEVTEASAWTFAFHAPHDGEGLAALHGGAEGLLAHLEEFFAAEETGERLGAYEEPLHEMAEARAVRMGQFGLSNQPAHHIPFLFHHAGAPHRAHEIVRSAQRRLFTGEQIGQGYPGDEDNGEMSAWWILTMLGLYPLQLGTGVYHLVPPLLDVAHVRPLGGEPFTIRALEQAPEHPYVQGVLREDEDGGTPSTTFIRHGELRGEIQILLGPEPGFPDDPPPSPTARGDRPRPLVDLLPRVAEDPLLDDDATTERTLPGRRATTVIGLPPLEAPGLPLFYTLTSGAVEGQDPVSWRLEGSEDGAEDSWQVLDAREGQIFPWRRQTRPFRIGGPEGRDGTRPLRHHRLVLTGPATPVTLAQVELLGHR